MQCNDDIVSIAALAQCVAAQLTDEEIPLVISSLRLVADNLSTILTRRVAHNRRCEAARKCCEKCEAYCLEHRKKQEENEKERKEQAKKERERARSIVQQQTRMAAAEAREEEREEEEETARAEIREEGRGV